MGYTLRVNPNQNYTLVEMVSLSWEMIRDEWYHRGPSKNFLSDFRNDVVTYSQITQTEIFYVAMVAALFTVHRYLMTKLVLNPFMNYIGFSQKDRIKFSESACKVIYYSLLYAFEFYLVIFKYPELRYDITSHWKNLKPTSEVPFDILALYVTEAGFYFHSIYATIFMDAWKKDSIAMLIHHVLANALILFSLNFRYHRIGLIVLYLHDVADISLESTKLVVCFKNKSPNSVLEFFSVVGFLSFTFSWFWSRLVIYPQIVLFSSGYAARAILPKANFFFLFNVMLWFLMCLNVWWFHFIVALIFRIASGQSRSVEDTREYEVMKQNGKHSASGKVTNGTAHKEKTS